MTLNWCSSLAATRRRVGGSATWEVPVIANGLGGLVDLATGFGLVMKPKPKREDKKRGRKEKPHSKAGPFG